MWHQYAYRLTANTNSPQHWAEALSSPLYPSREVGQCWQHGPWGFSIPKTQLCSVLLYGSREGFSFPCVLIHSIWDTDTSEMRCKDTSWSPRGGQTLLHSAAPHPTSSASWLSRCSVLHIWWCYHRALCRHCGPISSDSVRVVQSHPGKPGLSLQCQIQRSTSFPVL